MAKPRRQKLSSVSGIPIDTRTLVTAMHEAERTVANMKVTMTKIAAGPQGVARPGTVLELKDEEGREFISGMSARAYDPQRDAKAKRGWTKSMDEVK